MASIKQNKSFLTKHLSYEIGMLAYAMDMLSGCKPGRRASMYFECFAVHARNCRKFLKNEDGNNYKAKDFNPKFKACESSKADKEALSLITHLDTRVFHLAKSDRDKDPIRVEDAVKMYNWIVKELNRFGDELPDVSPKNYKATWFGSITPPKRSVRPRDPSASATNHFSNSASFAPGEGLLRGNKMKLSGDMLIFELP